MERVGAIVACTWGDGVVPTIEKANISPCRPTLLCQVGGLEYGSGREQTRDAVPEMRKGFATPGEDRGGAMPRSTPLSLTSDLVARAYRVVPEKILTDALALRTEEDHAADVDAILATRPPGSDLWLFAYGSLLWKPAFDHDDEAPAVAMGWHRSFCMRIRTLRGKPEQPGLMMALDRGGKCRGVAIKFAQSDLEAQLLRLVRREMPVKRADGVPVHVPRWIKLEIGERAVTALAYVINRNCESYAGRMTLTEVADVLSSSCGYAGSCADYLYQTVTQLQARGIHDSRLWQLQKLVAERLERMPAP